jgi:hypothetical protein
LQPERPRARRFPFAAKIELNELQSETQTIGQTSNLSLFGCHVNAEKSLPTGAAVWIRIAHQGAKFEALGRVANAWPKEGMGIVFTKIEENEQAILEKWIAELRDKQEKS